MATIALYANKINQMPGLIKDLKNSVTDYKSELASLKNKTLTINKSVCDLDDVINSIQSSTQTQEDKINSLETFQQNSEQFISDTVRIDEDVADLVKQRKDEFYEKYSYLKPECEKSKWEKFCDGLPSVGEWCKEHWNLIVAIVIVIVAVVLICTGVGGILGAMALGALWGAGIGGALGGVISLATGGSFWEGLENGMFAGAIAGIISGGMAFAIIGGAAGVTAGASLTLGQTLIIGGMSGMGASLISDVGDIAIKSSNISFGQVLLNMGISGALGVAFAGFGYGLSKGFTAFKVKFGNNNSGKVEFAPPKNNATPENVVQTKAYVRGCNEALKDGALSPTGRVSTKGKLGKAASAAAKTERAVASAAGNPYQGHVSHVPDTTWTGTARPHSWLDLNPSVNTSLGGQALKYPIGYQPTKFVYNNPFKFNISPSIWGTPAKPVLDGLSGN